MRTPLLASVSIAALPLCAQLPNGGFEELNANELPSYWQGNVNLIEITIDTTGESHSETVIYDDGATANYRLTNDAFTGAFAVELLNGLNRSSGRSLPATWSASSDSAAYGGFPLVFLEMATRPSSLDFQGKFTPVGGDTAYVQVSLFDENFQEIGTGSLILVDAHTAYTAFELPITYTSPDPVTLASLSFRTCMPGSEHATLGTRFLLDDVRFGFSTGIAERSVLGSVAAYPNPADRSVRLAVDPGMAVIAVRALDAAGRSTNLRMDARSTVDLSSLAAGDYVIELLSQQGIAHSRVLVQH